MSVALGLEGAGARRRRPQPLRVEDLPRMTEGESGALVGRDAVWPQPDWRAMVAAGAEVRAAALVKIVRDRVPSRPPYGVRQMGTHYSVSATRDDAAVRRDYVRMLSLVRDALSACRTVEEVKAARAAVLAEAGWSPSAGAEVRHLVTSVWRDRTDTLQIDYRDMAKAEQMVAAGWPEGPRPSWRRGYVVRGDSTSGFLLAKGLMVVADGFPDEAAAWEWLRADAESRAAPRGAAPVRPRVAAPVRAGLPDMRGGGDAHPEDLASAFGLASVAFGGHVPRAERQALLNLAFDALHDLAAALSLPPASVGLGGSLSLCFGGGPNGATGADYDPARRRLSLPPGGASGDLAHAWARAFDHWAGETGLPEPPWAPRSATGTPARDGPPVPETGHLGAGEAAAWRALALALWRADPEAAREAAAAGDELARRRAAVAEAEAQRRAYLERAPGAAATPEGSAYLAQSARWIANQRAAVLGPLERRAAEAAARDAAAGESAYAGQARRLGGRDGDFWIRPSGMFARAFECAVHDRLAGAGRRNQFLVHGVEEGRFAEGFRGDPYPSGAERRRASAAVLGVVEAMAPRLAPPAPEAALRRPGGA